MSARGQILTSGNTQLPLVGRDSCTSGDHRARRDLSSFVQSIAARPAFAPAPVLLQSIAPRDSSQLQTHTCNAAVARFLDVSIAENTRHAYAQDLQDFQLWGGSVPASAETVANYIADRANVLATATISRRLVGIARAHAQNGFPDPTKAELVRRVLRGIQRTRGCAQRQAAPLLSKDIAAMVERMRGLAGSRNRALLLLGFSAALRRSELAGLHVRDIEFVPQGLVVHVRRSKTDQTGLGRRIAVRPGRSGTCPVAAVREWLEVSGIKDGPIFRSITRHGVLGVGQLSGQSISLIVKEHAKLVGLDAVRFSGHSLRSGLVTSAIQAGVGIHKIQQQTGHKSLDMLARYIRDSNIFDDNASGAVL